tara:strand:+ start:818 stop:2191 length:1374 start_codon:yes stop_codon:yes gene_type:complete
MIDTIIFDLDGVLINSKNIHFSALNQALEKANIKYQITYEDHLKVFDGLPTDKKLEILNKKKLVKKKFNKKIKIYKDKITKAQLENQIKYDQNIFEMFQKLSKKYKLGIATNAIQSTLDLTLKKLKIKKFIKAAISTKNLKNPKPHPEIYLRCLLELNSIPRQTLILEDSHYGRMAAKDSGCKLLPVKSEKEVEYKNIINFISENKLINKPFNQTWDDNNLNIVIPMAGEGSRFTKAGYNFPKPLIEIRQKPMIQVVIESLGIRANYIFLVRKEHLEKYNLKSFLNILSPNCKIVTVDTLTEGAACTVLLTKKLINNNKPLIIANSDQFIEWNSSETMYNFVSKKVDGGILTFKAMHPKWSYAKLDDKDNVCEVAEKRVISNNATVGVYYWKHGSDFVKYAEQMIKKNIRVNNEFYVCPVYNEAIKDKKIIKIQNIESMWGLGTPEDLNYFLDHYEA